MRKAKIIIGAAVLLCAMGGALYYNYQASFADRFLPGTVINGETVGRMDAATALANLEKDYTLKVSFRGGTTEKIKGKDIDYQLESDEDIARLQKEQGFLSYLKNAFVPDKYTLNTKASYSQDKLAALTQSWAELDEKNMTPAKDACVHYENGEFTILPEEDGTIVNTKGMMKAMDEAITTCSKSLDLEKTEGIYPVAKVKADDPQLAADCEAVKKMKWNTVTYDVPKGDDIHLTPNITMDWLTRDEDGNLVRDDSRWNDEIRDYVASLADYVDTVNKKHKFKTHSGKVIKLNATGYYGWQIDQNAETAQLAKDLAADKPVSREPIYNMEEAADYSSNYGFGKNYVEVDLGSQHLWVYKKGKVILESDVVSGTQGAHASPSGSFRILDKARNVVLRGPQVKKKIKVKDEKGKEKEIVSKKVEYEWESPVSYWMPINYEGIGLHDASWRGVFGGDIWTYNGSHGCVNLPVPFAPKLYDAVKVTTPVAVYY